jgi:large subunit ribosomal protein L17
MKKNVFGRKFSRDINERKALFKSLMSSFILNESIQTTEAKAKAIKPQIEKLITKAKSKEEGAKAVLEKNLSKEAFDKIIKVIGPRFIKREGGYTRIIRLGEKFGDNAPLVLFELVEKTEIIAMPAKPKSSSAKASEGQGKKQDSKSAKEVKKVEKKPAKKAVKKTK